MRLPVPLLVAFGLFPGSQGDPLPAADPAVTRAALEHHVGFLASDELLGRATATPESTRVSAYLARVLERAGVEPGGQEDTYFQTVPLLFTEHQAPPELTLLAGEGSSSLEYGRDFSVQFEGDPLSTGELRLLVVRELEDLPAEPDPSTALVMAVPRSRSFAWLDRRGWPGGQGWGVVVRARPKRNGRALGTPAARLERAWTADPDAPEVVTVNGPVAERLWEGGYERLELTLHGERRAVDERNVVGIVPGVGTAEHPELAREVIVLSAHFDHIGVVPGRDPGTATEDVIRNGADDDASGTAVLLELAEAFAAGPPPARTLLFLFCTAEEHGMWGTYWFADHPTVELERIVCNLNFEMLGMVDEEGGGFGRPWLTGFERSNLGPAFVDLGAAVGPDQRPEQRFFVRSDNIVFVKKGIVGHTLSTGGDNPNYHQVGDEFDTLDFAHMEACARIGLAAARLLAEGRVTPEWYEGEPDLTGR